MNPLPQSLGRERVRDGAGFRHRSLFGQGESVSALANIPFIPGARPDNRCACAKRAIEQTPAVAARKVATKSGKPDRTVA